MGNDLEIVYKQLFEYCERENFAGWDPFDGLNSRIFRASPLKFIAPARLAWLQMVKRSGRNLRPLLKIEKGVNAKGIALFALAEMSRFESTGKDIHAENSRKLIAMLRGLARTRVIDGERRTSFGYNFDWQSRAFFAPLGTPTVVPSAFAADAFRRSFELFRDEHSSEIHQEIARFIKSELNRVGETGDEVSFSYTPLDRHVIFNASLLAAETLAAAGKLAADTEMTELARKAANFVIRRQRDDGAWVYGEKMRFAWVDNFHTAYILRSLRRLRTDVPGLECDESIVRGLEFWLTSFFLDDGTPKYYDKEIYPVDIHSAAAAIVVLSELRDLDDSCVPLAEKVTRWTISNLRDESGFFYYQKRRENVVKTPFIRWSNAWMLYALAKFLEAKNDANR